MESNVVTLPTRHGAFDVRWFDSGLTDMPHLTLSMGLDEDEVPLVRIHSECMTGDVFGSARCDCGMQLERALAAIGERRCGVLVYLRQEGRGIGLINKLRAYQLQDAGLDTIEANVALGLPVDGRRYDDAVRMLRQTGVRRCDLLTNNPDKVRAVKASEIELSAVYPLLVETRGDLCRTYLETKRDRMGHTIPQ